MPFNVTKKTTTRTMVFLSGLTFTLFVWLGYDYLHFHRQLDLNAKNNAKAESHRATEKINGELEKLMPLARAIADDLTSGKLKKEALTERLKKTIDFNPEIFGVGVAFEPFAFDPELRLYAPYYIRKNGEPELIQVESFYDYTETEYDWYHRPLQGKEGWNEPYFGQASDALLAEFALPFYELDRETGEKVPAGVIYINYTLKDMKHLMASLELGQNGYGFIISPKGTFIYHPIKDYVKEQKTIFDVAKNHNSKPLEEMGKRATRGEEGVTDYVNIITGQSSWLFHETIPATDWSMGVVIIKDEILGDPLKVRRKLIHLSAALVIFLLFLLPMLNRLFKLGRWGGWANSFTVALLFALMTVATLYLFLLYPEPHTFKSKSIFDKAGLNKYLDGYTSLSIEKKAAPPIYVPTGVFIQSIKFNSAHNVVLTGYIWQKYFDGLHEGLSRGFVMPEEESSDITEAYRHRTGDMELVGWYFTVSLRERFNYKRYPFGSENVWIRLWHKDFEKNIVLTPDLDSYNVLNPMSLPGLEEEFVVSGWDIRRSFFSYRTHDYNTNFGITDYVGQMNFPELYFNVIMQKDFISPFITNILPVSVVLFLLFAILMIGGKNLLEIVSSCAAFFLVVIFSQIDLREKIPTNDIIYMEYIYFITYFVILAVAVNSILYARTEMKVIHYENNLISHLLYWPLIASTMLVVTLFIFY